MHLENLKEKTHRASRFFAFYAKQKISLTWSNNKKPLHI